MRPKSSGVLYSPNSESVSSKPSGGVYVCLHFSVSVFSCVGRGFAMGRTSPSRSIPQITRGKGLHPENGKFGAMQTDLEAMGTARKDRRKQATSNCFGDRSN
jgi:hypothetical protein